MNRIFSIFIVIILLSSSTLFAENKRPFNPKETFKKCAKCHGKDGKNRAFGRSEVIAGQDITDLVESMKFYKDSKFKTHGVTKVMAKYIKELSYEEIIEIAKYISKL